MMYNVTQIFQGAKLYISQCCHSPVCLPHCMTASRMIAKQFTLAEASQLCDELYDSRRGKWSVEPVIEQPRTITIYLGSEVPA